LNTSGGGRPKGTQVQELLTGKYGKRSRTAEPQKSDKADSEDIQKKVTRKINVSPDRAGDRRGELVHSVTGTRRGNNHPKENSVRPNFASRKKKWGVQSDV